MLPPDAARDDAELGIVQRAKVIQPLITDGEGASSAPCRSATYSFTPMGRSRSIRTVSRTCSSMQLGWSTYMFTRLVILPPSDLVVTCLPTPAARQARQGVVATVQRLSRHSGLARRVRRRHLRPVSSPGKGKTYASRQSFCFGLCLQEVAEKKCPRTVLPPLRRKVTGAAPLWWAGQRLPG